MTQLEDRTQTTDRLAADGATGRQTVTIIPGDGIGPEITRAVRRILDASQAPIDWEEVPAGLGATDLAPSGLPQSTLDSIVRNRVAIKGPTETPIGKGHKSVNVTIRKTLDLFANVRPVRSLPGVASRYGNVDLVIVRENVEDTYSGIEHFQSADVAQCLKVITRPGSLAAARHAFELARTWGRKRVTCVHKANIHKLTDGLFLDCFREVAAEYPDIQADDILVDNACMQLVMRPEQFDVLVTLNLYGDILSDLCAGLVGGLGVAPGGNIGDGLAVFEAVHGSAPDIAGQGLANPTALLQSAIQMLRHMGLTGHAARIERAMIATLEAGTKTRDLGGQASTDEYADAIIAALEAPATGEPGLKQVAAASQREDGVAEGSAPLDTVGVDVFVQHDGVPAMPEQVGGLRLHLISNRGTKVFPGPTPDILLVDVYRCRYLAGGPVQDADILALLAQLEAPLRWVHVEKLQASGSEARYSKAQGE